jgi:thiamine transport system ATP-binding protein
LRPALAASGLKVERAGRLVLEVPALACAPGSLTVLGGGNGAGKSTLLLALAGLLDLAAGEVALGGMLHRGPAPAGVAFRRRLALVLQEPWLPGRHVRDAVGYGLRVRGVGHAERRQRVAQALRALELEGLAGRPVAHLSGGERRLTALGAALAVPAEVLLLDEVTAGLSAEAQARVEAELRRRVAEEGTTIVLAAHDAGLARRLGASVVVLEHGKVLEHTREE